MEPGMTVGQLHKEIMTHDSHLAHLQEAEYPDYPIVFVSDDPDVEYYVYDASWNHKRQRLELTIR
jgi:hypothetical protein